MRPVAVFRLAVTLFCLALPISPSALAQQEQAAVLLLPDNESDRELADDLTEVLISALIEKGDKSVRFIGKESFRKSVTDKKLTDGKSCLANNDCIRKVAAEMGLRFVILGKFGKNKEGYALQFFKLLAEGGKEKTPFLKQVEGDLGQLIQEVEGVAAWACAPDPVQLTVKLNVKGAQLFVDGNNVADPSGPLEVPPGDHVIVAKMEGYSDANVTVSCQPRKPCSASLNLERIKVVDVDKGGDKGEQKKKGGEEKSSLMPYVYVLGGLAVLSAGGGLWMYSRMMQSDDDIQALIASSCGEPGPNGTRSCSVTRKEFDSKFDPILERGQTSATWATIFAGVSIGSALGAATLLGIELFAPSDAADDSKTTFLLPVFSPEMTGIQMGILF